MGKNFIEDIAFGAQGSTFTASTSAAITPPAGNVYVAIYILTSAKFDSNTGLIAESATKSINSAGIGAGAGGQNVNDVLFEPGTTIYGRWTSINLVEGSVIAYIGN